MRWLGFDWGEHLYHASDYFEQLYEWAVQLIKAGKAYVDDLTADQIREHRGTLTEPGQEQPLPRPRRSRRTSTCSQRMREGRVPGRRARAAREDRHGLAATSTCATRCCTASCTPRHPRTGDAWCIYPTYDYAHGQSDAIEGITHSICTLEFEDHRPLYDWFIENLPVPSRPRQIRVRAPQPHLHRALQALPAAAGERGPRARLGRPAHADASPASAGAASRRRRCGSSRR